MADQAVTRYLKWDMHRVAGYLETLDAKVFAITLALQAMEDVRGSLAEIGVHHGRSFFLMAMHRRSAEKSLAIDLFEDDDMYADDQGLGRGGNFERNRARLGIPLSADQIVKGSSLELTADEILSRSGPVRFFSIDGGHRYEHVENDLALAQDTLHDEGVIVVDDFASPFWPEVTFATYDWLRGRGRGFAPFATTPSKLYLSRREHGDRYRNAITSDSDLARRIGPGSSFLSDKPVFLDRSFKTKARDALLRRLLATDRAAPRTTAKAAR